MICLPKEFDYRLKGISDNILASIGYSFDSVGPILERNEATFFPDFTDHGKNHVKNVLRSCELIIGDEAWKHFTREDIAVLAISVLAHDLGMLINSEGFRYLISNENLPTLMPNDEPWLKLWREFQLEVRRFDGATLMNIVGSTDPISIEELSENYYTERSIKIIGEFLRRHHHRIAHEVIAFGMPSGKGRVDLFKNVTSYLKELAGLLARSHGVPIRESVEYFCERDPNAHREYRYVHPTFLITILRIADYLDLDVSRVPESILSVKELRSPISKREWWSHKAIVNCHSHGSDPECLHLIVEPSSIPDVETFSIIEEKINGLQQELDSSWATLGEVYGRFAPLNQLTLKIRRIRSDIRAPSIIDSLPYVPHRAFLESSKADLLKLLIEPLYGDEPGIGIRELVQNSTDAVRELEFILKNRTLPSTLDKEVLEGDVEVYFEKDESNNTWIVVADNGIGMTWSTVAKFYLTAGASFRQSSAWRKSFTDETGSSKVLRSGRFGIGVLAAFLLGDRVQITTRHIDEPINRGIKFEFGLEDSNIEMRWINRKIGTTVKVRTNEKILKDLFEREYWRKDKWDWFCLGKPLVLRKDVNGNILSQKYRLPGEDDKLNLKTHRIQVPGLQTVNWSYHDIPGCVCNGIYVTDSTFDIDRQFDERERFEPYNTHLVPANPRISVFDPDGLLPLDLARKRIASRFIELESCLADDICRNIIAFSLIKGPQSIFDKNQFLMYARGQFFSMSYRSPFGWYFCSKNGFGLTDPWNIFHFASEKGLLLRVNGYPKLPLSVRNFIGSNYGMLFGSDSSGNLDSFDSWIRELRYSYQDRLGLTMFRGLKLNGLQTLMPIEWFDRFTSKQKRFVSKIRIESQTSKWVVWSIGDFNKTKNFIRNIAERIDVSNIESITEFSISQETEKPKPGRLALMWKNKIGNPVIPFNQKQREKIINNLGPEFARHLKQWKNSDLKITKSAKYLRFI